MYTIGFSIQKGGTGKTSLSVNVASELAKQGFKTVLIDIDPQGTASNWLLEDSSQKELADYLFGQTPLNEVITKTTFDNLDILPTYAIGGRLGMFADTMAQSKIFIMQSLLEELEKAKYEFAILDFAPAFNIFARNSLVACDEIITPIITDEGGIDGIEIFSENLVTAKKDLNSKKPIYKRIVLNAMDSRIVQLVNNATSLKDDFSNFEFYTIPTDQAFRKSQALHKPIQALDIAKKETLSELERLAKNIAERKK